MFLSVLAAVGILSITTAATGYVWDTLQRREREAQLLKVGNEIRQAIERYHTRTPGTVKTYPDRLEDLLLDKRQLQITRYLRRIYEDPITRTAQWGLVRAPEGGIKGVYSLSMQTPIKMHGFRERDLAFEGMQSYADWKFVYEPKVSADHKV